MTTEKSGPLPSKAAVPFTASSAPDSTTVGPYVPELARESDVRSAAMAYGKAGLYLAPTRSTDPKNPGSYLGSKWQTRTVTGGADAYAIFGEEYPDAAGIALHCGRSGVVVVDIDTEDEYAVPAELLRAIKELEPPFQTTRRDAALRGHYLFQQPHGRTIGNSLGKLGKGWGDVRGTNGVIILPPSLHKSASDGGHYEWQRTGAIPVLPTYVADLLPDGGDNESTVSDAAVEAFLSEHVSNMKPHAAKGPVTTFLRETDRGGGRHLECVTAAAWLCREARAGLHPARDALQALRTEFLRLVTADPGAHAATRSNGGAVREFRSILAWAVAQAIGEPPERIARVRERAIGDAPTLTDENGVETLDPHPNVLPSPNAPALAARALAERLPAGDGVPRVKWWRDEFYRWRGAHYEPFPNAELEKWIYEQTEHAEYIVPAEEKDETAEGEYRRWHPNIRKVAEVSNALAKLVLQHVGDDERVLACRNGVIDPVTRERLDHTPRRFNLNSLPFDYDPLAECPRWLQFLDECLPGDTEAHNFLGEWFGYVLSGRTDQQKMASLIGKRRGGKGTIARVLTAMVGKDGYTNPDIADLGSHFGRASLIGKSLAVMSDVRWNSNLSSEALRTLLYITGEDAVTIPRKHKDDWTGRSGVRFMVLSNDVPSFADRSNAIGTRMIHVKFDVTFEGREDFGLENKLMAEMAGILNWALAGLYRLNKQGRFTVPRSGLVIAEEMEENANPVRTFIEDRYGVKAGTEVDAVALLNAYTAWAEARGMKRMEIRTFMTALRHVDGVTTKRVQEGKVKVQKVYGVNADPFDLTTGVGG